MTMKALSHALSAVCAALTLTLASATLAADRTWTGLGADSRWLTPENWAGNAVPSGSADVAIFPAGTPTAVLLDQNLSIKTIYFRNPGLTLTVAAGANLAFSNSGLLVMQAAENAVIDGDGTLTFSVNSGEDFADNQALAGKTLTILARITGTPGFEHNGNGGTITLANAGNDQAGNTVFTATGVLAVPSVANAGVACPLGKGSAFKFTTGSTTLRYTGTGDSTDRSFYQNAAASQDVTVEHAGSGTLTFTGPFLSGNNNGHAFIFNVVAPDAVIQNTGVLSNGGTAALWLYKRGAGTQVLSAANTYTGNTVVDEGTLALPPSGALSASSLIRLRGGTLLLNAVAPAATYTATFGALQVDGGQSTLSVASGAASAQVTFASLTNLSGAVDFVADGLGTTTKIFFTGLAEGLIGPWATVNNGAAFAAYSASLGVYATNLTVQALQALGPSTITNNAAEAARITSAGTGGGITLGSNPTGVGLLAQDVDTAAAVTFGGQTLVAPRVQVSAGAASLTLGSAAGDGALTAPASSAGKLFLANANAAGGAALVVNAAVTNNGATAVRFEKSGPGDVVLAGPVAHTGGTSVNVGTLTLSVAEGVTRDLPASGVITGVGGLTKTGSGTLAFPNLANTYAGTTTLAQGTARVLNSATFGTSAGPTVVKSGGAIDFRGITTANALKLGNEQVYAEGEGPDGLGALRNDGTLSQYWALSYLTLTGPLTVSANQRLDIRGDGPTLTYLNLNGHGITKKGSNMFGLTHTTATNDLGTSFIDITAGSVTLEEYASLSGGTGNTIRVRGGAFFDLYNIRKPIDWSLSLDDGGRLFTRNGFGTNFNVVAGPVTLGGRATFESGGAYSDSYSGDISGTGPLVKSGSDAGLTYLRGTNNAWSGGTLVSNSTLCVAVPGSLPGYATDVLVTNSGCLAFRVGGTDPVAQPGWTAAQIDALVNNGTTFQSTTASVGFETAYENLDFTFALPQIGVRKLGPNTLTLSGAGANLGPVRVFGGTLDLSPVSRYLGDQGVVVGQSVQTADPLATLVVGGTAQITTLDRGYNVAGQPQVVIGDNGRGVMRVSDMAKISGRLLVGNGAAGVGSVRQTGGTVQNTGGANNDGRIGHSGYGYYALENGVLTNSGLTQVGWNLTALGILKQTGGTFAFGGGYGGTVGISRGGTGVVYLAGGQFLNNAALEIGDDGDNSTSGGYAALTVAGSASVTNMGLVEMGNRNNLSALLNLCGGELTAPRVWRASRSNSDALVNWDGGLLRVSNADFELFSGGAVGLYPEVTVYDGGAVVDIPNAAMNKVVNTPLRRPQGLGLISIPVATSGSGYLGAPFVRILGGGGKGASAFAHIDPVSGALTSIEITSSGTGYTTAPAVALIGGGATTAATLGAPVIGLPASGGLTKLGGGALTLVATNTFTGPTEVREGSLRLKNVAVLSPLSEVSVTGGTLDLGGGTLSNGNVTVTGGRIVNGRIATAVLDKDGPGVFDLSAPVTLNTNLAERPLTPGLWEGMIPAAWNTTGFNPQTGIQLTTRAAIGPSAANTTYAGGLWNGNNHTWIYSGYIWNRSATNELWTFRGRFDDNVRFAFDGAILINGGNSAPSVSNVVVSPGPHAIEARFGDGSGSAGPSGEPWGISYDPLGRASSLTNDYRQLLDPGNGSLLTVDRPAVRGPGLEESVILQAWNTTSNGTLIGRQLTTRAGNGAKANNVLYANGMWRGGSHTWIYKGILWNRTNDDVTWTWRFTFDDNVMLKIDDVVVKDVTLGQGVVLQNHTLTPGSHPIEIRFGDGSGDAGPASGLGGLTYDPLGRGAADLANYILLQDPGDGSLLTTDVESGMPAAAQERPVIRVNEGTLRVNALPVPGLWEGMITNNAFDTASPNPSNVVELSPIATQGACGEGGSINGKPWPKNTTYVYSGYIWNRTDGDVTWTFAENFDDNVKLTIAGTVLIANGNTWNAPTKGTITLPPGPHPFEARFGQGGGGAAGNVAQWWTNGLWSFAVDWQGRDSTNLVNYVIPSDPGDGSVFTCGLTDPLAGAGLLSDAEVDLSAGATLDLGGSAQAVALLAGTGTVTNGVLAEGTVISPAGDGAVGALALNGVTLAAGTTYRLTVDGAQSDVLTSSGALDLSGLTVVAATANEPGATTYVIAHAEGGLTGEKPALSGFPSKYKLIRKGNDLLLTSQSGTILQLR